MVLVMRSGMEARRLAPMSLSFKNPLTILWQLAERNPREGSSSARESLPRAREAEKGGARKDGGGGSRGGKHKGGPGTAEAHQSFAAGGPALTSGGGSPSPIGLQSPRPPPSSLPP